jgi:hypothetical protein
MGSGSDSDVLDRIAELKEELGVVKTTLNTHVKPENNVTDKELNEAKGELKEAIKQGKDEQKTVWEALLEAIGLKDFFEAFKQMDKWIIAIVLVGATLALLKDRVLNYGRILNTLMEKISGKIFSVDPQGGTPRLRTRQDTEASQAVAINPRGLTQEQLNGLTSALRGISPEIREFNSATREMKPAATINKIAKAIGNLKEKLVPNNPADDIRQAAGAVDELNTSMAAYRPEKLPKPQTFRAIATAAQELNREAGTLKRTFLELSQSAGSAAGAIGGGGGTPSPA